MAQDANIKIKVTADTGDAAAGITKVTTKLKEVPAVSSKATQAITDMGRVLSDLPYGFMGISNNIEPLRESFQRLQKETGSTGATLKALASSLMGGGGLGLVFPLITSAISFATIGLSMWTRGMGDSKKATDDSKKSTDDYAKSIEAANKATAAQATEVGKLVAVAQLQTTSLQQRAEIIRRLQGINETYFSNLKLEAGQIVGLAQAYKLYAENIFRVAQAKAAGGQIEKLNQQLIQVTQQADQLDQNFTIIGKNQFIGNQADKYKQLQGLLKDDLTAYGSIEEIVRITGRSENEVRKFVGDRLNLKKQEAQIMAQIADLSTKTAIGDKSSIINTTPDKIKEVKTKVLDLGLTINDFIKNSQYAFKNIADAVPPQTLTNLDRASEGVHKLTDAIQEQSNLKVGKWLDKETMQQIKEMGQAIRTYLVDPISDFFVELTTGGDNAFSNLISSLSKLIVKMVATIVVAAALAAILAFTGVGAFMGLGSGVSGFKEIFTLLSGIKMAKGGIAYGPQMAYVGEYPGAATNPEVIAPLDKLKSIIGNGNNSQGAEFRIRGVDLVAVTGRANRFITR